MPVPGASKRILETLSAWEGITISQHRFGGWEFRLGRREIGHIHGDFLLDIPFPRKLRDELVSTGQAEPHHILPETGWVSFYLREPPDVDRGLELLKRSYELAVKQKAR